MTEVQFLEVKPFVSCCRDLEVVYHIPSSIKTSSKHYIALYEVQGSNQFTWVWAGKTILIEQEGITVKWRKGKVSFANQVLPKLSDGREYFLMYCNEDGTILGQSRPFQFTTDADEFSSIDLQSAPSEDAIMISIHPKKEPSASNSEVSLHNYNNDDDTMSFEVLSEQKYSDTIDPLAEKKPDYFSQSVTSTVITKGDNSSRTTLQGSDTKSDELLTSSYSETKNYQNVPKESNCNQENIQLRTELVTLKETNMRLEDEVAIKDTIIEELKSENTTLKEQVTLHALSNSTVVINSPKEDKENRIYKKRIQDEIKKSTRLEELLDHKEAKMTQLESEINSFKAEARKMEHQLQMTLQDINALQIENRKLNDQIQKLQTEQILPLDINPMQIENKRLLDEIQKLQAELFLAKQQNSSVELLPKRKIAEEDIADLNIPVGGEYKTKLYIKLFKQDPFICHVCNEVLPAHTQEFSRLNHVKHCKGGL